MSQTIRISGIASIVVAGLLSGCAADYSGYSTRDLCVYRLSYSSWEIPQGAISKELATRGVSDCSEFNDEARQVIKQRQAEAEQRKQKQMHDEPKNRFNQTSPFL